jgi:hypothetical protein
MISRLHKTIIFIAVVAGCAAGAQAEGLPVGGSVGAPHYGSLVGGDDGDAGSVSLVPQRPVFGDFGGAEPSMLTPADDDSSPAVERDVHVQDDHPSAPAAHLGYEPYQFTSPFDEKPYFGDYAFGLTVNFW